MEWKGQIYWRDDIDGMIGKIRHSMDKDKAMDINATWLDLMSKL